jgi:EAL domain-containing protein (putative c-di-GMP-specific phosphodiesterase class I)
MSALAALGTPLALDDFGTGYSCLNSLKHLPLRAIKIDRAFTEEMLLDPADAAIVETVLSLAQKLNMATIAEGVETDAQRAYFVQRGCDLLQGFLFSAPLAAAAFEAYYRAAERG